MHKKTVSALALAAATAFPDITLAFEANLEGMIDTDPPQAKKKPAELPALGGGVSAAALIAAGLGAALALASGGGGGGSGGDSGGSTSSDGGGAGETTPPPRPMSYTSASDFRTPEYNAQHGLGMVKAEALYYNGHQRWSTWEASDPAAGTGIGVKIAVADTGINAREASTSSTIAIDVAASYDYIANTPGSGSDEYGHGTHVAGLIAAPKNNSGMHGLAYNASVVNFKFGDSEGRLITDDAVLADMMSRAANAGAMIINNSWGTHASITSYSTEELQNALPRWIEASRAYIAKGGVVVFAAGNDMTTQPSLQAGLPYRISGLEQGWLAVVAIDGDGRLAYYSNHCGVASRWCLAAPGGGLSDGGLYSMQNNDGYERIYGTSMAAPHAAAGLAALKSMFPNLSYLQLRDRLLRTADKSGPYSDASVYGAGLMDLATASSPLDGISVPTGTSATGATASVSGSGIEFPAGALRALGMQGAVLVVDNYQRAPFWVPAQSFFREATPRLIERQWASLRSTARSIRAAGSPLRFSHAAGLNNVVSADLTTHRLGFSKGAGGEAILGSHLELVWIPSLAAPGSDSVALGYSSHLGAWRIGLLGSLPSAQATNERTVESSSLGARKALGFVAQQRDGGTTYGASLAFAEQFERPLGMATSGAFGVNESAAVSSGMFVEQALGAHGVLKAAFEVAHHSSEPNGTLITPAYAMRAASFGARTLLGPKTALSADVKREWTGSEAARLHVPLTINENGDIGRIAYALPYDELLGRTSLTLRVDHELTKQIAFRAGLTHERYGYGVGVTGLAAILEIAN